MWRRDTGISTHTETPLTHRDEGHVVLETEIKIMQLQAKQL